ncbi:MAG: class I SAM-dependent methyltransferase, partial [Candidatus Omnitrophica bacterium]|nr:class I SAM-dependent methyltransferase [Candidatus Omnitrophota bacterium]
MNIDEFLNEMYALPGDMPDSPVPFKLVRALSQYIYDAVDETSKTLETGAGLSTIVFALRGTHHICITPNEKEVINIVTYCKNRNISLEKINFQVQKSEDALPHLQLKDLDLVLIDGRHAFPTPFIDWYYASSGLKTGGILIVDDTNIWTGKVLEEFLCLEAEWKLIKSIPQRAAIFTKRAEGSHSREFHQQSFVMRNSLHQNAGGAHRFRALYSATRHVYKGEMVTLVKKITHRIRRYFYGSQKCEKRMQLSAAPTTTNNEPQFWAQQYNQKYDSGNTFSYDYPEKAMISLTSRCNLCCWHCSEADRPGIATDMPREFLEYIVKNILVHCQYVRIGGADIGEPLFSKDFKYFFKILDRKNNAHLKEVSLITNLTLLDREKADIIAENVDA